MRDRTKPESDMQEELELLRKRVAELSAAENALGTTVKQLRDSEELYRSVVNMSPAAVTVTDLEANITHVSDATLKLHGYDRADELIGKSSFQIISPEDRDRAKEDLKQTFDRGAVQNIEYRMLKRDGGTFAAELNACVVSDFSGKAYALMAVVRDVTEQRQMEEALRGSEEKFRELVENINDVIYRLAADGTILYVSPAIEAIIGYGPSELLGHRITDYIHPDDVAKAKAGMKNIFEGNLGPTEVRNVTRTGEIKWVNVSSRPVYADGKIAGLQGVMTDITERKKAEQEAAFLGSVIEKLKDGCIVTDLDFKIVYVNDACVEMFGYSKNELLGESPDMLNAERMAESVQKDIYETVSAGGVWESAIRNRKKNGDIFVNEFRVSPLHDKDGNVKYYIGIQRDVTEKKKLEQELNQAQKMEAVGTMAGGIAHDFNNLLTAIIGYSELLLAECEPGSVMQNDIAEIDKTARRAAALTRRLLTFAKGQTKQVAPVDLNTVVSGLDKMLNRLIGENIELRSELAADLPRVSADAGQIEQVIVNLVLNSRDAMPKGGRLTVGTKYVTLDEKACRGRPGASPGNWVCLTVRDDGQGMDPKVVERVFEPFYTTKEVGRGTGLGLSVVFGIVKSHQGWIEIKSEPSKGTEVAVFLAGLSRTGGDEDLRPIEDLDLRGNGERVLLVEDQDEVRALAKRALEKQGYIVFAAVDCTEALEVYEKEGRRFDIVFSDVVLPDRSGVELAERIRSGDPEVAILLTSGYTDQRAHWGIIEKQGYGFLRKPYDLAELVRAMRKALDRSPAVD
jgi:two-component system cell cycle sensor histidine kinase/response regulator CckA